MSEWQIPNEFALPKGLELRELAGTEINPFTLEPPGPVGEAFMYSTNPIDMLMGPAGSGKSIVSLGGRTVAVALRFPVCKDGIIRVRIPVIRDNFRELYRTTLPSLFKIFPRGFPGSDFTGGQDRPFCYTLRFRTPKGKGLQIVLDGFGVSDDNIEGALRGYECSAGLMEEADLLSRNVKTFLFSRVAQGRYPGRALYADPKADQPRTVWGTFNPPVISHYLHEDLVEKPAGGHVLRRQPSGLSDAAENRKYVPKADYEAMALTLPPDMVRRMVQGEWGLVGDGALVYPSFDYDKHVAKSALAPLDLPLRIGMDAKGTPAGVIFQHTPKGKIRVLDEVIGEPNMSAGRFSEAVLDLLQANYRGLPIRHAWGDPTGFYGADRAGGEISHLETVGKLLNCNVLPTQTNDPKMRQEAVDYLLRKPNEPKDPVPYYLMSPTCKNLLGGFQGGFLIKLNKAETSDHISFVKNKFSHGHEAQQYGIYGSRGHADVMNDAARAGRPGNITPIARGVRVKSDFNV